MERNGGKLLCWGVGGAALGLVLGALRSLASEPSLGPCQYWAKRGALPELDRYPALQTELVRVRDQVERIADPALLELMRALSEILVEAEQILRFAASFRRVSQQHYRGRLSEDCLRLCESSLGQISNFISRCSVQCANPTLQMRLRTALNALFTECNAEYSHMHAIFREWSRLRGHIRCSVRADTHRTHERARTHTHGPMSHAFGLSKVRYRRPPMPAACGPLLAAARTSDRRLKSAVVRIDTDNELSLIIYALGAVPSSSCKIMGVFGAWNGFSATTAIRNKGCRTTSCALAAARLSVHIACRKIDWVPSAGSITVASKTRPQSQSA